jgi:DNA-binding Lrp family transcriptional regulator
LTTNKKYGKSSLFIFRKDLRIEDNTGLLNALLLSEKVILCFIFDTRHNIVLHLCHFYIIFNSYGYNIQTIITNIINIYNNDVRKQIVSKKFKLLEIDLKIMRCLLADPRMNYLDIAKKVSSSQRTIIRRFEKLLSNHVIINFGIIHNPSKMKGYNYFSIIVKTEVGQSMDVMKQITYSELNNYILRLASFNFENAIIINFHSENVLDIESILNKVKTFNGVKKVDAFHRGPRQVSSPDGGAPARRPGPG